MSPIRVRPLVRGVSARLPVVAWANAWPAVGTSDLAVRGAVVGNLARNPWPSTIGANAPAWADATNYTVGIVVSYNPGSGAVNYRCIVSHVSNTANDRPSTGANWATYWVAAYPLSVVDAAGSGLVNWPTANALRASLLNTRQAFQNMMTREVAILAAGQWPIPVVGQTLYMRLYKSFVYPDVADPAALGNNNHPIEQSSGGGNSWSWNFNTAPGGWCPSFNMWTGVTTRFLLGGAVPIYLPRNTTVRMEWATTRLGVNLRSHQVRIAVDGGPTYTTADFATSAGVPLSGYTDVYGASGPTQMDRWWMGTNGPDVPGAQLSCDPAWYIGASMVSLDTWCGPYVPGNG